MRLLKLFRASLRVSGTPLLPRKLFWTCAVLATAAIWLPRYPAGIDLPQHANLFQLWVALARGPIEFRNMFRVQPFTPYLLPYAMAYPLTWLFGAIAATKCLLTVAAIATPIMMSRWLAVVGAERRLGLFGFLLAFDYQYHWGFFSESLALPLMFGYFAAFERQGHRINVRAIIAAFLYALGLFFSHGITFGFCMLVTGFRFVLRRWPWRYWHNAIHWIPIGVLTLQWIAMRKGETSGPPGHDWFINMERLTTLFSGPFMAHPDQQWAKVSLVSLGILLIVARPGVIWRARTVIPFALAMLGFVILPDWMASTWHVGPRFCVFVHALAPAVIRPRTRDWLGRQVPQVACGIVAISLLILTVRLFKFNQELAGFHQLIAHMEPGFDVRTMMPETTNTSDTFGPAQFGQVPAWITAARGGLIENDSSVYYQIPLKRNEVPFPTWFRYLIAHGDPRHCSGIVASHAGGPVKLVHQASNWLLYEAAPLASDVFTVVRTAQGWGKLQLDHDVDGKPLSIGSRLYAHGLGTHAESFIRLRFKKPGKTLQGACGIDDRGAPYGHASFRIRADSGRVLFESGRLAAGMPAHRFTVPIGEERELLLEVSAIDTITGAHGDWVDLTVN